MRPLVLSDDDGIRRAGPPDACFYCRAKVGESHGPECVAVHKRVKVRYTVEFEIEVPAHWDEAMVLFSRNEGSRCASNMVGELVDWNTLLDNKYEFMPEAKADQLPACMCPNFRCEVVDMRPDAAPYAKRRGGLFEFGPAPKAAN